MIVKLGTFEIANGNGREYQVLDTEAFDLDQETQQEMPSRAAWPVAFYGRASRAIHLEYPVTFPPCATLEEAVIQARTIPITCPKGGVLVEQHGETLITYAQAWVTGIRSSRMGVTNQFVFSLLATDPDTAIPSTLALMDARYTANLSAITGLTGGTASDLDGLVTADVAVGFLAQIFVPISGLDQLAAFRLQAGTDATNTDPLAGPVVVRPVDYDAGTNAKVWMRLDA